MLSNPEISTYITTEVNRLQKATHKPFIAETLGVNDALYHKHFIVQIVN